MNRRTQTVTIDELEAEMRAELAEQQAQAHLWLRGVGSTRADHHRKIDDAFAEVLARAEVMLDSLRVRLGDTALH